MVRETRHLWVGNLPDNIREDRIREHFKRYGRVQSVKLLPRSTKEDTGENTMACTVAFMDIKSASKARDAEHKIDDRTLTTEYYEPVAIPSAASPQNAPSSYSTSPGSTRFPNGHGPAEEHSNFSDRFYDRPGTAVGVVSRVPDPEYRAIRTAAAYHENNNRGRNRDRTYRTNGPYNNIIDRPAAHRINAASSWSTTGATTYDANTTGSTANTTTSAGATRYNNTNSDTGYSTTPSEPNERRNEAAAKKKTKSRSGSRSPSPSGSNSSRSVSRSRSRSSSSSSSSATSRDTSATSSPRSRKDRNHQEDRRPLAICVKNLPCRSSDTSLKDGLFHEYKKHGKVTSVKVVGQSSERHAIVCFKKPEDVEKALEVSYDKLFFGSKIEVAPYQGHEVDDTDSRLFEADIDEFNPKATRTLFIGNLEKDVTASDLRKHFDQFGEIIEIDIKKQGAVSSYAFCQYSDIMSVVKAIRALDGEHLGNNRIKLGFGKSMPTSCVWIDGITETVSEKYLINQFETFGAIQQVIVDREKGQGLVFFEQVVQAQAAVNKMRGVTLGRSRKLQIDFASRECQDAFYDHLEKQGHVTDRIAFEERIPRETPTNTSRFSRYETPTRPRTASYSSRTNAASQQINSTPAPSPGGTPGSVTPRGSRSSRVPRHPSEYYDQANFRSYDEYSQGSGASHEEPYDHEYPYHESPSSHVEPAERIPSSTVNDHPVAFPAPDIRNLQKERVHILEQLDDCSSGDEVISPKKKIKLDHQESGLNCDVIIEANRDHRKVMEVRRLSDASTKHHSRRPSIDSKHRELTGHDRNNPYLPHAICKRRKTAGSDNGSRAHHYDQSGSESVGGSRPGTPLCDEKPEHLPSEPRRTPRDREGPLTLPLPRFAAQIIHKGSISVAGIKGQKDCILSSPPAAVTSPRITKPPSPVHVPPPASPPPRPPSLSSSSSDSDGAPPSPSLDERIRSLDEKYEKWSGSRALSAAGGDALAKLDANRDKFKIRHKLLDLNVLTLKDLQPSEIVKSVMAKRSVFDEDSKRLENLGEKYEPREFCLFPKVGTLPQPVPVIPTVAVATSSLLKISTAVTQLPKTPVVLSPRSTSTGIIPAKGLQYPFPSHPPVQQIPSSSTTPQTALLQMPTTPPIPSAATSTTTCPTPATPTTPTTPRSTTTANSENRLNKQCSSSSIAPQTSDDSSRTQTANKVCASVNRTSTNNQKTGSDTKVSIPLSRDEAPSEKPGKSSKSRRNSVVVGAAAAGGCSENATKTRRNSECGKLDNCDSAEIKDNTEEKEREERLQREKEERLQKEREERLEKERLQKEREEKLQKEKEERLQKEREERLQKEREERLQKEREDRLQKEREERLQKEREERLQKEREERLQKEREERLQKEREERLQKEREERLQKEREERLEKERLQKEREERLQKEREEKLQKEKEERLQKEREERLQKEREERLQKEREERLQKEREERERRDREDKERKDKEDKERREREEQERLEREKQEKEESERLQKEKDRERAEKERRRDKEDRHKEDNHHRHRENHSENNKKDHEIRKEHDSRNHDSREQKKHHSDSRDSERRKENTKENRENNTYEKSKNNNEIKDRPSLETRHMSIDLDKNRQTESSKGDPSRRKERNNSLPAHVGSKRRLSGHDEDPEAKKPKLDHKKIVERRNSKDGSSRDDKNKKYIKSKSHDHKHNNEKRKDKDRSERKSEKLKSSSKSKEKSREKDSPSTTPTTPGKDMALEKDFLSRLELSESEKHKKEKKDREKRKLEDEERSKDKFPSIERKREEMKQLKKERIRKLTTTNSSENSDSDEPKKHSIFDIVDDEPAYISMYDKVKARSCKNMQKQEEEKRQEKIKAKFSQLKQSRAKREEKKRSTSWDEDSDSDHEAKEMGKRKGKMLIQSSDEDEDGNPKMHRKKEYSDSDSERNNHNKNFDTSDDDHIKSLQRKGSKSRITSDTSDDDFKPLPIKNEIFTDNEDQFDFNESLFKPIKEEMDFPKKEKKSKLQDDISVQIFGEASSADESMEHKEKLEIRKKHKKKQKKKSSISDDSIKDEPNSSETSEKLKKKQHSKKDKKRDKSKDELREKSKKSKKVKENKRDGKMENIFGSLSDDSETGSKDQNEHKPYNMMLNEDLAGYLSDSDGVPAPPEAKNEEKERILKEEHRKRKDKKRREKERQRRREEANENSMDFSDLGKQLEANIKDDSNEVPEVKEAIKVEPVEAKFDTIEDPEYKKEERKDKEKKKKRKKSKDEKNRHHHHHHHHEKNKVKEVIVEEEAAPLPNLEVKVEETLPTIVDIPSPPLTKSSPTLDTPISPTELVKSPTKEKKKFIPGFGVEIDEAIHENAVKSISEFEPTKEVPEKDEIKEEKVEPAEEKPRVVISQEETEDAVAALLGESFGSAQFEDYSEQPISPINPPIIHEDVQDDEEMRQAVQSLNSTELDIKPETPQSENDLQIDTDTEDQEDISLRFDQPPKTPDAADLAQPPKTPDIPNYYKTEAKASVVLKTNIGSPPSLTPIKPPQVEAVKKSLELPSPAIVPEKLLPPVVEEKIKVEPKVVEVVKTPPVSLASMPLLKTENLEIPKVESPKPIIIEQKPQLQPQPIPNTSGHNVPSHIPPFVSQKQDFVLSPKNMNRLPITTGCVTKPLQPATLVLPQAKIAQTIDPVKFINEKPRTYPPTQARHHLGFIPNPSVSRSPSLYTSYQLSMQGTIEKPKVETSSSGIPQYRGLQQSQPLQIEASVNISLTDLSVSSPSRQMMTPQFDQAPPSIIVSSQGKSNISISNISVNEVPAKPYMPVIQETPKVAMSDVRSPTIIQQAPPIIQQAPSKISLNVDVPKIEVKEGLLKVEDMRTSTPSPVIVMNKEVKMEVKEELPPLTPVVPQVLPRVVPQVVSQVVSQVVPQVLPSIVPSMVPSMVPSIVPSIVPSVVPSVVPSMVPPVNQPVIQPVIPVQSAIEKVTEELNLSLEKENLVAKDVKVEPEERPEEAVEQPKEELIRCEPKVAEVPKKEAPKEVEPPKVMIKPEEEIIKKEELIKPVEDSPSVIKEIEKIEEDKAETDSVVSDISKERLSAEILSNKDDPLDSKEDSDYWSAKEVNIDSVIKKVDALCSADELSDRSSEIGKEDWFDDTKKLEEKPEEDKLVEKITRRGGRGRGARKTRGADRGGVQTRRGKITTTKEVSTPRRGARGGRGGRGERKITKTEQDADVYEFRDDSDDAKDRSRFILTIHKPTFSANGNVQQQPTAIVREVMKSPIKPTEVKQIDLKQTEMKQPEEFASPVSNTRKSKRLQEKDVSKSNVDDTIEDVIKNTPTGRGGRRSQRATVVAKADTPRKSPRARKNDRRPSETTDDSSEEKKKVELLQEAPKEVVKIENGEPPKLKEKPHEGLKAAVLRRVKDEMSLEPMTLIDPVTGHLTPMRECEEGKYIPVALQNLRLSMANAAQPIQPSTVLVKQKPHPLKAHVLSFQNANKLAQNPVVTPPVQPQKPVVTPITSTPPAFIPRSSPLPVMQSLNVNVSIPSYVPPHVSPRPSSKPVPSQLSPILKPQPPSKTLILNPIIQPPVNTQIAHAQPSVVKQPTFSGQTSKQIQAPVHQVKAPIQQVQGKAQQPKPLVQQPKPLVQQAKPLVQQPKALVQQPKALVQQPKPVIQQQQQPMGLSNKIVVKQHGIPQGLGFPGNRVVVQPSKDVKDLGGPAVPKVNNVPQQRHVLPAGMPVPAYDASLGEGMAAHFPPGTIQMRSHDLPPHYMHAPHMMYQQLMRQQFIARSPMVPMEKRDGDGQEGEEAPVTSPPLELRRPGSVGLALNRTSTVPHSLQSPKDRTTDSPQVYGMHTARMQHYHAVNRIFDHEPPPAHRAVASTLPPITNEQRPYGMGGAPVGIVRPDRPLSNDRFTPLGQPDRPLSTHSMTMDGRPMPYNLPPERNLNIGNPTVNQNLPPNLINPNQIPKEIVGPLTTAIVGGISVCVADALARQLDQGGPPGARSGPVSTPPQMQPAVPPKGNLYQLLQMQHFPIMWQGLLALKNDQAAVQMYYVSGNDEVAKMSLPKNIDGSTPPLRIFQRMRLEPPQVEGVTRKMQAEKEHCMLIALPCGKDHDDALEQHTNLSNGLINYLTQKQAAGIINIAAPGTTQPPAYVVHIFPSCDFVNDNLRREAPELLRSLGDLAHLLIIITTV